MDAIIERLHGISEEMDKLIPRMDKESMMDNLAKTEILEIKERIEGVINEIS